MLYKRRILFRKNRESSGEKWRKFESPTEQVTSLGCQWWKTLGLAGLIKIFKFGLTNCSDLEQIQHFHYTIRLFYHTCRFARKLGTRPSSCTSTAPNNNTIKSLFWFSTKTEGVWTDPNLRLVIYHWVSRKRAEISKRILSWKKASAFQSMWMIKKKSKYDFRIYLILELKECKNIVADDHPILVFRLNLVL